MPSDYSRVLYAPIADSVIAYCFENDIAIHSEFLNLKSSQACCFNVMYPLRQDMKMAIACLEPLLPNVLEIEDIEFEYAGDEEVRKYLGESKGGKRGQNRTSIDVYIKWRDSKGPRITLVEWKYTESNYGDCGGYNSKGNNNKRFCEQMNFRGSDKSECYLTQGRNARRYWEIMAEAGIDENKASIVMGCPFRGPFYQLLRQFLVAGYLRREGIVIDVASVSFRANTALHEIGPFLYLKPLGQSIPEAWNNILGDVPKLRIVHVEEIINNLKRGNNSTNDFLEYLADRYGL